MILSLRFGLALAVIRTLPASLEVGIVGTLKILRFLELRVTAIFYPPGVGWYRGGCAAVRNQWLRTWTSIASASMASRDEPTKTTAVQMSACFKSCQRLRLMGCLVLLKNLSIGRLLGVALRETARSANRAVSRCADWLDGRQERMNTSALGSSMMAAIMGQFRVRSFSVVRLAL